ncbi:MAG: hypothetical protein K6F37_01415 [Lachnospiraceae bacterium]|nr:hypothetical protein [Lachnospiraceae bacterium]
MLFDVIIRTLAAAGLATIINANGITTITVVMSVCIFLILEASLLVNNKAVIIILTAIPFIITLVTEPGGIVWTSEYKVATLVLAGFTAVSEYMYRKMQEYKELLNRSRDDSREMEAIMESENRRLLLEQDKSVHVATLAERNRIAREIHDNVGHLISRAILLLGAISTVNRDEKLDPQLKMLADTLDESMAKMRESVHDLHDDSIDLERNFREILDELKEYKVNADIDLDEDVPTNIKLALIGILKEAVTNIVKHSSGDEVSVILQQNYSFCTLSVTDNGFLDELTKKRLAAEDYDGIGLINIKNRARSAGGDAYFYTNDGFTVFVRLPFVKEQNK